MTPLELAERLRHLRLNAKETVGQAADRNNMGRWNLYRWEHGEGKVIDAAEVITYIESFGCTVTIKRDPY